MYLYGNGNDESGPLVVFENKEEREEWCLLNDVDLPPAWIGLLKEEVVEPSELREIPFPNWLEG